ncbi:thiopeptide-type bacteriocin biosynthesis protein [Paucibacter sp. APW11]|uniref:Thiopeptide-type bacteriocin biosynthesis protein n=1 Tax=Roseateles aquae TaxID=3077235 RepID=A0ABU3PBA9_9BURK|nr:thiopeptide-type bacteriocin biosynthesis protein [Paucibacter sp. APW11]MDT8999856.1 thiopeptide-type bacteriocin biosynthesis protein [Paucibacter sp. APW11]
MSTNALKSPVVATPRVAKDWLAMHIYLSDPALNNAFLCEWMHPRIQALLQQNLAEAWFFVRYWEGGPHLRVRVKGLSASTRASLLDETREAAQRWLSPTPPSREAYYGAHGFDGAPVDKELLPWHGEGAVNVEDYEPEWVRYGGAEAMLINERLFERSSQLCVALIKASGDDIVKRLGLSLGMMAAIAQSISADVARMAEFFEHYADYWSRYSSQTRTLADQLDQNQQISAAELQRLREQLREDSNSRSPQALMRSACQQAIRGLGGLHEQGRLILPFDAQPTRNAGAHQAAIYNIISSQLHMMNNRLGLVPAQEIFLAKRLSTALRALHAESASAAIEQLAEEVL